MAAVKVKYCITAIVLLLFFTYLIFAILFPFRVVVGLHGRMYFYKIPFHYTVLHDINGDEIIDISYFYAENKLSNAVDGKIIYADANTDGVYDVKMVLMKSKRHVYFIDESGNVNEIIVNNDCNLNKLSAKIKTSRGYGLFSFNTNDVSENTIDSKNAFVYFPVFKWQKDNPLKLCRPTD